MIGIRVRFIFIVYYGVLASDGSEGINQVKKCLCIFSTWNDILPPRRSSTKLFRTTMLWPLVSC